MQNLFGSTIDSTFSKFGEVLIIQIDLIEA